MALFSRGMSRLFVLALLLAGLSLLSPDTLARGPNLCLWRHLFHLRACPACGSTRALAALFHGHFAQALAFNRNVLLTAPLLLGLGVADIFRAGRKILSACNPSVSKDVARPSWPWARAGRPCYGQHAPENEALRRVGLLP